MRACCDLQRSGRSLRRDRSALRGFRSLTPFGECLSLLGLDAMQVISLEGCTPLGSLGVNRCLILRGIFRVIFQRTRSLLSSQLIRLEQHEHSARVLLADWPQLGRVSPSIRSCNVAERKRHGRRHLRRREDVFQTSTDFRNARQT
jgi:hypothetical protein